jgi:hypothetical protein
MSYSGEDFLGHGILLMKFWGELPQPPVSTGGPARAIQLLFGTPRWPPIAIGASLQTIEQMHPINFEEILIKID